MSKHTPGPWRVVGPYVSIDFAVVCKYCDNGVGPVQWVASPADPVALANARLIAAAPDLLVALQSIADSEEYDGDSFVCDFATLQGVARAAIAKATGGA